MTARLPARAVGTVDAGLAWDMLRTLRREARRGAVPDGGCALGRDGAGRTVPLAAGDAAALVAIDGAGTWHALAPVAADAAALFDLYLPLALAGPDRPFVIGHLGVSLDGQIATSDGGSYYITGQENIRHLHRLRALADAVVVGAGTVAQDDPRLTTRLVEGDSPVRVVIDPRRRLGDAFRVFTDGAAETLLCCEACRAADDGACHGGASVIGVPADECEGLALAALLDRLRRRGLNAVLVEGGGVTVSRFLAQDLLDRLHLAVAPLLVGAGRPGLSLPPVGDLAKARRPRCRAIPMGADTLFDCDLAPGGG